MNFFQSPIAINETSFRVTWLHQALKALGRPVDKTEEAAKKAGDHTLQQVRACQQEWNIQFDDSCLLDHNTYEAIVKKLKEKNSPGGNNDFVVNGTVYYRSGPWVKLQKLIAFNVDLKGVAIYNKIGKLDEIKNGGFEYLDEAESDRKGFYSFKISTWQFVKADSRNAEVVIFAVDGDAVIGRSRLISFWDDADKAAITDVNIIVAKDNEQIEYNLLMEKLTPFLEVNKVKLEELSASYAQIRFTAGEIEEDENKIRAAADAETLHVVKKEISHELLYGLGRQQIPLNWVAIYKKKDNELEAAIKSSTRLKIINKFSKKEVQSFLSLVHEHASSFILKYKGKDQSASLEERLSVALPKKEQREAFVIAVRNFKNKATDKPDKNFWKEFLPNEPVFKNNPKLIDALLLSQRLTLISGNHLPLVKELQGKGKLSSITELLEFDQDKWKDILTKAGVPEFIKAYKKEARIKIYTEQIQSVLNAAFPTQKIAVMLDKHQLPVDERVAKIIKSFITKVTGSDQSKGFDIGSSPVHEYDDELKSVAKKDKDYLEAKRELNRIQRVFQVSPTPEVMGTLMRKNLNSAYSIASFPKQSFIKMHSKDLGGDMMAEAVYQRAEHISALAAERAMKMYDLSHLAAPQLVYSKADREKAISVLEKQVSKKHNPNYSELFGSPDICECGECRSVYSAAAYFIDILRFLWRGVVNADGKSPLDMFALRRPDLLHLPLTCENTNTIIPYIDLVNEVMEYYTAHDKLDSDAAHDTGETTADELRASPQNFKPEAYRILKNAVYPFSLPYHQPLDVIRTYGEYLKTERHDVMKALQKDNSVATVIAIESEALRISEEEFRVLTTKKFDGTDDIDESSTTTPKPVRQIQQYFGYPFADPADPAAVTAAAANLEKLAGTGVQDGIHEFLRRSGMKYTELVDLIKTTFINPNLHMLDFLNKLFIGSRMDDLTLYAKLKKIKRGRLDLLKDLDIMIALSGINVSQIPTPTALGPIFPDVWKLIRRHPNWAYKILPDDFKAWVQRHFDDLIGVITLFESESLCKLDTTNLRTIKNRIEQVSASGITPEIWSKIHRFIRLWRKLGWTIQEVDLMLAALGQQDIAPETIRRLSSAVLLNKELKLPVNQLATFWGNIDSYGDKSLYKKLFLNKAVQRIDPSFQGNKFGEYLKDSNQKIQDHIPAILAAFRMSDEDLQAILDIATVKEAGVSRKLKATDTLNISNLSTIYRYMVLSKALQLKVTDCCLLIKLFNETPFSIWNIQTNTFDNIDPASTFRFYELVIAIKKAGFKPEVLQYIFNGTLSAESTLRLDEDKAKETVRTIREAFNAIEQDHPDTLSTPLTSDILRSKLSLSFNADVVNQFVDIIEGRQSFSVLTTPNLQIKIPPAFSSKYTYIKASGRLACTGTMSDAERRRLKRNNVNQNFRAAVDAIYHMPEDFIKANFSGVFTDMRAALITLLNHPAQPNEPTLEAKLQLVYNSYLPLLKQKLREDAVNQHIAALIGLSEETTVVLIKNDVKSLIDSLAQQGFSADYFSNTTPSGVPVLTRVDRQIKFDSRSGWPGAPISANTFSARWQGYVSPPSTGEYTLIVAVKETDEIFRLYLDNDLILEKTAARRQRSLEVMVPLNTSRMHRLILEYSEISGQAGVTLSWKTATTALETIPSSVAFPAKMIEEFIANATVYHRASKFISGFNLSPKEINHFIKFKADFNNINFKAITPIHWKRMNDYVELRNAVPQAQASLVDIFAAANIRNPLPAVVALTDLLNLATAWDKNSVSYLISRNHFGLSRDDFKNEVALSKLNNVVKLISKTGISAEIMARWAAPETDFDTAELVKSAVKAKYEVEDWLKLAAQLSNKIRENQKQALISYLLTKQELIDWGVKDADGLFEYFLIDVQMGLCLDTSRIVQANAAVQMFVNRCLLNLESKIIIPSEGPREGVSPEAINTDRWEWMKYYRVWEVNRKIFLYPENWLEPEWRDDRSAFFKELESELVQNDITPRSVETAFRNYLTKLNTVANLDVCGVYQENDAENKPKFKLLHVFGCTHNAPYQFFYRTWNEHRKWSAWEKVPVDIRYLENGENSGVHLIPVVWKNRLLLFWPEFMEKPEEKNSSENLMTLSSKPVSDLKPGKYWEIRLAWCEYIDGKWSPKQVTKEFIKKDPLRLGVDSLFLLSDPKETDGLAIIPYLIGISSITFSISYVAYQYFEFYDIQSKVEIKNDHLEISISDILQGTNNPLQGPQYQHNFQKHVIDSRALDAPDHNVPWLLWNINYFTSTKNHNLIFSNNLLEMKLVDYSPFFYQDAYRTYFVRPVDITVVDYIKNPYEYGPFIAETEPIEFTPPEELSPIPTHEVPGDRPVGIRSTTIPDEMNIHGVTGPSAFSAESTAPNPIVGNTSFNFMGDVKLTDVSAMKEAFGDIHVDNTGSLRSSTTHTERKLEFHTFYHPYSSQYVTNLNKDGVKELMESDTEITGDSGSVFGNYDPNWDFIVQAPASNAYKPGEAYTYYKENVCFDVFGANSIYNWELFFHAPLYIATRLSRNGKYEEAMKWFHYIFDPTTNELPGTGQSETSRYWKVLPFKTTPKETLEEWFRGLSANKDPASSAENGTIKEWRDNPFKPFVVARNRPLAFMKNVVIKYVENLVAWGDSLFRMFTRESINEALQIYVIANHILGPRPEFVPKRREIKAETYDSLKDKWDDFSNALVEMENIAPYSSSIHVSSGSTTTSLLGIGRALYFCIPSNDKLLEHWNTVADRLLKIRHCKDIDGVDRQPALFSPPIDPALLINAAAQGLSLGSILSDLSSPPPIYRFNYLIQRANDFCNEVKSLGSSLLSVLEKKEAEELSRLRSSHEIILLDLMTAIKERQVLDANVMKEGLLKTRKTAEFRFAHYNALLSPEKKPVPPPPTLEADLNTDSQLPPDTNIVEIKTDVNEILVDSEETGVKLIFQEKEELDDSAAAQWWQSLSHVARALPIFLNMIPEFHVDMHPFGAGFDVVTGGPHWARAATEAAEVLQLMAGIKNHEASVASKMASYIRREQEWTLQANLAAKEIIQLDKQITSADIKIQVAKKDLENHKKQIDNAKEVEQFLKDKFTNQELYQWMKEQLVAVYKQSYNMAYDMAKKVEKCYRFETGNEVTNFIQYGYWDNTYQGLCAGEKLQLALRQLEKSYLEENKRELELTKNISIAMLNPLALQELRTTGRCFVSVPEELYDLDYQGHYFRRIKSVRLSLPCIAGPFITVNCTLRLLKSTIRINTAMNENGDYEHNNDEGIWADDVRFRDTNVPVKAIAASTGLNDSGMFELNFRDERYLPFEGAGAISEWKIELTQDPDLRQFDYSTISDVILHISYTAREDAGLFKDSAVAHLKDFFTHAATLSTEPFIRMFSMKHEFSTEWNQFLNPAGAGADQLLNVTLKQDHFPFFTKGRSINVKKVEVLMKANNPGEYKMIYTAMDLSRTPQKMITSSEISMPENVTYGNMQKATLTGVTKTVDVEAINILAPMTFMFRNHSDPDPPPPSAPTSPPYTYNFIDREEISDLFLVIHYSLG